MLSEPVTQYLLSQCLNAFTMSLIACAEPHTAPTVPKIIKKISFPAQNLHKQHVMYALLQMHTQAFCRALDLDLTPKWRRINNTDKEEEGQNISQLSLQRVAYQLMSVLNRMR